MVAPYVASKGTASAVTTGASTPTYPASVAANDIIFLLVISHQPVSIGVIDTPTSFTEVAQGTYANSGSTNQGRAALFWRRASGSLTGTISVTRTGDTGVDGVLFAQMYRVVGAVTSGDPWDAATTDYGPGNATIDIPSVTVSAAERTLLAFVAQADNAATVDPPPGYIGLVTDTTTTGTDAELRVFHRRNIDTGAATTAAGGETTGWASFHVSVKPAATYSAPSVAITGDAIRFDGAQDVMKLDPVDATGLIHTTMTCWVKLSVDTNSYQTVFAIEDGGGHSTAYNELITDADGTTLVVYDHVGLQGTVLSMTVGTWYAVAIKFTAGAWKSYYGTQGFTSLTTATGTKADIAFNDLTGVGSTTFTATESLNGMFSMYRVWSAALSDAEIKAELQSSRPVRTNDLIGSWFPLGVSAGNELSATLGNPLLSRGVGTPDWTFAAGPTLPVIGTGTTIQGNATSSGSGTVVGGVTGTGTSTQTNATSAATGLLVPLGAGASTQTDATSSGAGAVVTTGTGASTQGAATSAGTGAVGAAGTGASTQSDATSAGVGLMVPVGTGASSQTAATSSGAGTAEPPTVTGTGTSTQGDATATGVGLLVPVGAGASTQDGATSAGAGDHGVAGTGATAQGDAVSSGVGLMVPVGAGASTQTDSTSAGTGTAGLAPVTGTGASTQTDGTATGVGLLVPVGVGSSTQDAATSVASGAHGVAGTGATTQSSATASGTGLLVPVGTGASAQSDATSSGSGTAGEVTVTGTGTSTQTNATSAGVGLLVPVGSGASTQSDATSAGAGVHSITGAGASTQDAATSAGTGAHGAAGTGATTQSNATSSGAGAHAIAGAGTSSQTNTTSVGAGVHGVAGAGTSTQSDGTATGAGVYVYVGAGTSTQTDGSASGTGLVVPFGWGASSQSDVVAEGLGFFGEIGLVYGSSSLTQSDSVSLGVGVFVIPTPYLLRIEFENRQLVVPKEISVLTIESENRVIWGTND